MANLSQIKRQKMLTFLDAIRKEHKDDDEALIAINEIENELNEKKYGLVWERHEEAVDVQMRDNIPVFTECKDKEIAAAPGDGYNFILEGDNLHSLRLLEKTHSGRIDVIYIDPPYNTGSRDFVYDDAYVVKEDGYRHSKWLSFMEARLRIAHNLLSDKGAIFISIDDNEQAQLKLLCDEIWGEECFVADISWQRTYSIRNDSKGIPNEVEHILVYSKQVLWQPKKLKRTDKMDEKYKSPDGDPRSWTSSSITAPGASTHQGMVYAIQHPFTGEMLYPSQGRHWSLAQDQMLEYMLAWAPYELRDLKDVEKRAGICGLSTGDVKNDVQGIVLSVPLIEAKTLAQKIMDKGVWPYFYFTNNGKGGLRRKTYLDEVGGRLPTNYFPYEETGHTDEAIKEVKKIFNGAIPFDTPKPTRLLKHILEIASDKNSVILDFFAGSGTIGHAVLKQNMEDGGHRQFILCTNNENNICEEVTFERIKRVINGYGDTEGIPANVKYFRTDFVSKDSENITDELLAHISEMVELENGIKLDGSKYLIVLSDEEVDELEQHWSEYPDVKALYVSKNVLFTTSQRSLFSDVDIHIIPDYYFKFEMQEVGEAW